MLALDSTIGCIEASEPDVLDMYRSAPLITTPVAGSKPESCEAYVCAIRRKSKVHVYVALVADNKRIFVYTTSQPDTEKEYHHTLQEALDFAGSMGFTPERMNLNYSPAMREVVVRNIKILRPPGSKVHALLKHGMADAPTSTGGKKSSAARKHSPPVSPIPPVASTSASPAGSPSEPAFPAAAVSVSVAASKGAAPLSPPAPVTTVIAMPEALAAGAGSIQPSSPTGLTELQGALSRVTEAYRALQKRAAEEVASLRKELARSLADCERVNEQLASVRVELLEDKKTREKGETEAVSSLKDQLATLCATRDELAAKVRELSDLHLAAGAELAATREDRARLGAERDALALRIEAIAATSSELAVLQREVASISAEREEATRLKNMLAAENAKQAEALARAHQEIAGLVEECARARQQAEQSAARTLGAIEARDALQGDIAQLSAQRDAALAKAGKLERERTAEAARAQALRGELAELSAQLEASRLRAGKLEQERSAPAAQAQTLRGELAELSTQLEASRLRAGKLEQERTAGVAQVQGTGTNPATPSPSPEMPRDKYQEESEFLFVTGTNDAPPSGSGDAEPSPVALQAWASPPAGDQEDASPPGQTETSPPARTRRADAETDWYAAPPARQTQENFSAADDDFFPAGGEPEEGPGRFLLQAGLTAIEYAAPADVVELHQSINLAQLSPEGKQPASCLGFVCCLRTAGAAPRVTVALFGAQSGRTWVYLPEVQPEDQQAYRTAVAAAISFAEEVGFIMEPVQLGPEVVRGCKVLRCTEQK